MSNMEDTIGVVMANELIIDPMPFRTSPWMDLIPKNYRCPSEAITEAMNNTMSQEDTRRSMGEEEYNSRAIPEPAYSEERWRELARAEMDAILRNEDNPPPPSEVIDGNSVEYTWNEAVDMWERVQIMPMSEDEASLPRYGSSRDTTPEYTTAYQGTPVGFGGVTHTDTVAQHWELKRRYADQKQTLEEEIRKSTPLNND